MKLTGQDFAERWQSVVRHVRDGAERLQATADDIPPELVLGADPDLRGLLARHARAFADYTVALNCLGALVAERSGNGAWMSVRSVVAASRASAPLERDLAHCFQKLTVRQEAVRGSDGIVVREARQHLPRGRKPWARFAAHCRVAQGDVKRRPCGTCARPAPRG